MKSFRGLYVKKDGLEYKMEWLCCVVLWEEAVTTLGEFFVFDLRRRWWDSPPISYGRALTSSMPSRSASLISEVPNPSSFPLNPNPSFGFFLFFFFSFFFLFLFFIFIGFMSHHVFHCWIWFSGNKIAVIENLGATEVSFQFQKSFFYSLILLSFVFAIGLWVYFSSWFSG